MKLHHAGDLRSSVPLPRAKKGVRRWQVELGADGLLRGCEGPPTSAEASSLDSFSRLAKNRMSLNDLVM